MLDYLKARWAESSTKRNLLRLVLAVVVLVMLRSGWNSSDIQAAIDLIKQVIEIMAYGGAAASAVGVFAPDKKPDA